MSLDYYIQSGGKRLRCGFTTGTCAALAAAGATAGLLTGVLPDHMSIVTPAGVSVEVPLVRVKSEVSSICGVHKDAGDDRDVTDGILIVAEAFHGEAGESDAAEVFCGKTILFDDTRFSDRVTVRIEGGPGVGRVTKPGLDQPVGAAAINSTPRRMIEDAVRKVCESAGYEGAIRVCISVPDGEKIAAKTFNGHLGIEGGISILGTSGIVKPMSMQAYIDAVNVEIRQHAAMGKRRLILTPGNYGKNFLHEMQGRSLSLSAMQNEDLQGVEEILRDDSVPVVMCSNFIGDALDSAGMYGFEDVLLTGHIGKMVKLAGGIMNTHSLFADCRTDLFCAHAAVCGARTEVCREIMSAATTDACLGILEREGIRDAVMDSLMSAICGHLSRRIRGKYRIHVLVFSNTYGILGVRTV